MMDFHHIMMLIHHKLYDSYKLYYCRNPSRIIYICNVIYPNINKGIILQNLKIKTVLYSIRSQKTYMICLKQNVGGHVSLLRERTHILLYIFQRCIVSVFEKIYIYCFRINLSLFYSFVGGGQVGPFHMKIPQSVSAAVHPFDMQIQLLGIIILKMSTIYVACL